MLTKERSEKLTGFLIADPERANTLLKLEAAEALLQINALGNDFTLDEIQEYGQALSTGLAVEQGELSADALDNVSGGLAPAIVASLIAGGVALIIKTWDAGYTMGKDRALAENKKNGY